MRDYSVKARRVDGARSVATTRSADIILGTGTSGQADSFNPAELFLASIAACMIKGIERVTPLLDFAFRDIEVRLTASRQDRPPKIVSVGYEILVDTDEDDHRLELLHSNVRKFGTITNTISQATELTGTLRRRQPDATRDAAEHRAEIERLAELSRKQLNAIPAPGTDVLHEGP